MYFTVNGQSWKLLFVGANDVELQRSNGTMSLAVTDNNDKTVYVNWNVHGAMLYKVLCHELCHVFSFENDLHMPIETEEIVADFLATYGRDVFAVADDILSRFTFVDNNTVIHYKTP